MFANATAHHPDRLATPGSGADTTAPPPDRLAPRDRLLLTVLVVVAVTVGVAMCVVTREPALPLITTVAVARCAAARTVSTGGAPRVTSASGSSAASGSVSFAGAEACVPNAALRIRPTAAMLSVLGQTTQAVGPGTKPAATQGVVWTYTDGVLSEVPVHLGVTDGTFTELLAPSPPSGTLIVTAITVGPASTNRR